MLQKLIFTHLLIFLSLSLNSQESDSLRIGIHQIENEFYSTYFPKEKLFYKKPTALPSKLITTEPRTLTREVLGWHPYWASSTAYLSYDYKALSHIAYFSYEVDTATGGYTSIHDWNTTPVIDYAHQQGTKVLLTVTNFGTAKNTEILSDTTKQKILINTLIDLLKSRNGDGINFDFESVALSQRNNLVGFIRKAVTKIKAEIPESEISMATPAVDWSGSWDLFSLSQLCDYLIVMGYDYYWQGSSTAGPVAPIEGETYNITRTLYTYLSSAVPPEKLFLGVPWYGYDWPVVSSTRKASASGNATARVYSSATQLAGTYGNLFDQTTKVPWLSYTTSSSWRQLWFEDDESLSQKYNLVNSKDLAGIGIWALSYEGERKEIWEKIILAFTVINETENKILNVFPNPVSDKSKIVFFMSKKEHASLKIYDLLGREKLVIVYRVLDAGSYSEPLNIEGYGAGIYLCVLKTNSSKSTWKIVVI